MKAQFITTWMQDFGKPFNWIFAAMLLISASVVKAASIGGQVLDDEGFGLRKVAVCLKDQGEVKECSRVKFTDRNGNFDFNGLKPGSGYSVEIFRDKTASKRRYEAYKTYVWSPDNQPVSLEHRKDAVTLEPFVGKFNFSNFQRVIRLTDADFPELREFSLADEYVVLKVSFASQDPEAPPETVYLGQVTQTGQIQLDASVPLSTDIIDYEIYSLDRSATGSIVLSDG